MLYTVIARQLQNVPPAKMPPLITTDRPIVGAFRRRGNKIGYRNAAQAATHRCTLITGSVEVAVKCTK